MMYAKGAIKPVQELSEKVGDPINPADFLGAVAGYYSSSSGKLVSMPFNSSTPVMYYNKDAFQKAGLNPDQPPKTWPEVAEAAKKLRAAGMECGYSTAWPSWVQLENFAAWHNVPYASENNGFGGLGARLKLDNPLFKRHMTFLADMAKAGTFTYGGRGDAGNALFISGKCGMYTGSSGMRAAVLKNG
jgi:sn-glycerol 3-phosphate transport system substrate-binding protein